MKCLINLMLVTGMVFTAAISNAEKEEKKICEGYVTSLEVIRPADFTKKNGNVKFRLSNAKKDYYLNPHGTITSGTYNSPGQMIVSQEQPAYEMMHMLTASYVNKIGLCYTKDSAIGVLTLSFE